MDMGAFLRMLLHRPSCHLRVCSSVLARVANVLAMALDVPVLRTTVLS
jgi:hypothetical protein